MISQHTIQQIQNRIDIVEVLSDFISLKRRGVNLLGLCPFHGEKTPSFTVSPSKQIYKCFGCGKSGSAISFLMEHDKLTYPEALRWLANKYNITIEEVEQSAEEKKQQEKNKSIFTLNDFAQNYFHHQLLHSDEGKKIALSYLDERKINVDSLQKFQLGFCPSSYTHDAFYKAAKQQQFSDDILFASGLIKKRNETIVDAYSNRIIFPIHLLNGKVAGFGARRISNTDEHSPKYINTPQNDTYNKSHILYGIHFAKEHIIKKRFAFLVEGYTDVISLSQIGQGQTVASAGTALTSEQILLLKKLTTKVVLFYDSDAAGVAATQKAIQLLIALGMDVDVLSAPAGEDPDSFASQHSTHSFEAYLENNKKNFLDYLIHTLITDEDNIQQKSNAVNVIAETLAHFHGVADLIKRQEYIKYASKKMDVDIESLHRLVNLRLQEKAFQQQKNAQISSDNKAILPADDSNNSTQVGIPSLSPLDENYFDDNIKQLIFILIQYGNKHWQDGVSVASHIYTYLETNHFFNLLKHAGWRGILEEYKKHFDKGHFMRADYFLYHEDDIIRQLSVDIFVEIEKPNQGWKKLLPDFDEQGDYCKDVRSTLALLTLKMYKKLIAENQAWNKQMSAPNEHEERITLETHKFLKEQAKQIADEMGNVLMK